MRSRNWATRLGWGTADQALSTLSNVVITMGIARLSGLSELGNFTLAYAAYTASLGVARAVVSEPAVTYAPEQSDGVSRSDNVGACSTTAILILSVFAGGLFLAIGLIANATFIALAFATPFLLLQDHLRMLAFRRGRPVDAATLDALWLGISGVGVIGASQWHPDAPVMLAIWAFGALLGCLVATARGDLRLASATRAMKWWWLEARQLGTALTAASIAYSVGTQSLWFSVSSVLGAHAVGSLKIVQVVFGPLSWMLASAAVIALPEAVRARDYNWRRLRALTALSAGGALAIGLLCCAASPWFIGTVSGQQVPELGILVWPALAQVVFAAAVIPAATLLRARRRAWPLAASRMVGAGLSVPAGAALAAAFGLAGGAWAFVIPGLVYCVGAVLGGYVESTHSQRLTRGRPLWRAHR